MVTHVCMPELVLRLFYLAEAKTELSHNRVGSWVLQRELTIKNLLDVLITMIAGSLRNVSVPTSKTLNSAQKVSIFCRGSLQLRICWMLILITMISGSLQNVSVPTSVVSLELAKHLWDLCLSSTESLLLYRLIRTFGFVLWIMRELSMTISVQGETRILAFVSDYPTPTQPQHLDNLIGGVSQQVRQVLKKEAGKCINCRSPADLVDTNNVLKLFFVPVYRWPGKQQLMHCNNCNVFFPPSLSPVSSGISDNLRCRFCDREVHSDFRFCPFCGSAL